MVHSKILTKLIIPFSFLLLCTCTTTNRDNEPESPTLPDTPGTPDSPAEQLSDTIEVKIIGDVTIEEMQMPSRAGNSNDLIGVEIIRQIQGSSWNAGVPTTIDYACGIFDNIDDIMFKFVRGGTYNIKMCYYPNAKNIVYNYPNGTFGSPFSDIFGLQDYKLNEPVYYSGSDSGWSGNQGAVLTSLLNDTYQPGPDRYVQASLRGETPRYGGVLNDLTIEDDTAINIPLELCMMTLTLNPTNFTEGELSLVFANYMYMENPPTWNVKPGDEMSKTMQIPYYAGEESLQLYYITSNKEKYLLATKQLERKHRTNFVFSFTLSERADGSIGIQMPSDESFTDEDTSFDF